MRFERISMTNFRQYRDAQVDFGEFDEDKRITVIIGAAGGFGKTNLVNAITWCLYGKELYGNPRHNDLSTLNAITASDMKAGEDVDVVVMLEVLVDGGHRFRIERSMTYEKKEDDGLVIQQDAVSKGTDGSRLAVGSIVGDELVGVADADGEVQRLFPLDFARFFFIGEEGLSSYLQDDPMGTVRNDITMMSRMDPSERSVEHLDDGSTGEGLNGGSLAKVAERTRDNYLEMTRGDRRYTDLSIDEGCNIALHSGSAREHISWLSMTYRQLVTFSYILALNEISTSTFPMVIDRPFGCLDIEKRRGLVDSLPDLLKGDQTVLLLSGAEYTPGVREVLLPSVSAEFHIEVTDDVGYSSIIR